VLLAAYDEQVRSAPPTPPAGVGCEQDGPLLRIVGQFRGFVSAPRDVGLRGAELDRLIARQRDYFAQRGEAVEWKTRGHDEPCGAVPHRDLRARGGVAGVCGASGGGMLGGRCRGAGRRRPRQEATEHDRRVRSRVGVQPVEIV